MNDEAERVKIDELASRIEQAEGKHTRIDPVGNSKPIKMSRIGFDFMGSVLGGAILGVLVDKYFPQVAPWALIVMIVAGFMGGVLNVWCALSAPQS